MNRPNTTSTDHQEWYKYARYLEWKLELEDEREKRCENALRAIVEIQSWMLEINVDSFDKYKTALRERIDLANSILSSNH